MHISRLAKHRFSPVPANARLVCTQMPSYSKTAQRTSNRSFSLARNCFPYKEFSRILNKSCTTRQQSQRMRLFLLLQEFYRAVIDHLDELAASQQRVVDNPPVNAQQAWGNRFCVRYYVKNPHIKAVLVFKIVMEES